MNPLDISNVESNSGIVAVTDPGWISAPVIGNSF